MNFGLRSILRQKKALAGLVIIMALWLMALFEIGRASCRDRVL